MLCGTEIVLQCLSVSVHPHLYPAKHPESEMVPTHVLMSLHLRPLFQERALSLIAPGAVWSDVDAAARVLLLERLAEMGLVRGSTEVRGFSHQRSRLVTLLLMRVLAEAEGNCVPSVPRPCHPAGCMRLRHLRVRMYLRAV